MQGLLTEDLRQLFMTRFDVLLGKTASKTLKPAYQIKNLSQIKDNVQFSSKRMMAIASAFGKQQTAGFSAASGGMINSNLRHIVYIELLNSMHQAYRKIAVLQSSVIQEMDSIPVDLSIRTPSEEDEPTAPLTEEERFKLKVAQINVEMLAHTVSSFKESTQKIYKDSIQVAFYQ